MLWGDQSHPGVAGVLVFVPITIIMIVNPEAGWLSLSLLVPVWGISIIRGGSPIRRTPLDLVVGLFLLTAAVGVWAAYDRQVAWTRFAWVVTGILLYHAAAAHAGSQSRHVLIGTATAAAATLGLLFLLDARWTFDIGRFLTSLPQSPAGSPLIVNSNTLVKLPNATAGVMAAILPLALIEWKRLNGTSARISMLPASLTVILIAAALIVSSSRGAWVALLAGATCMLVVWLGRKSSWPDLATQSLPLILLGMALLTWGMTLWSTTLASWLDSVVPGLPAAVSRAELAQAGMRLIADVPFTGGGLGSFSAWYSRYSRLIPQFFFANAHNLYIDVAFEQGIPGLAALVGLALGGLWVGTRPPKGDLRARQEPELTRVGALVGFLALMFHGLIDDPIYPHGAVLLPFLLLGIIVSDEDHYVDAGTPRQFGHGIVRWFATNHAWLLVLAAVVLVITAALNTSRIHSLWLSDRGSLFLARSELSRFPSNSPPDGIAYASDQIGANWFHESLKENHSNRTALQRLGLMALRLGQFEHAVDYLQAAYEVDPNHRGVRKALGLSLAWTGQIAWAATTLEPIEEAEYELGLYARYWTDRGKSQLAGYANQTGAAIAAGIPND
ncbi:MAG: O-antigen ligase family protein [Anaerolineales bacterium]